MSRLTMKTDAPFANVEISVWTGMGIVQGRVALAMGAGAFNAQTYLTADELSALIDNLTAARDELIRAEFSFPAIEAIEVTA